MAGVEAAKKAAEGRTGWRIDGTLREFPKFPPVNLWFDFPVHRSDERGPGRHRPGGECAAISKGAGSSEKAGREAA